jgi:hypothetical protein
MHQLSSGLAVHEAVPRAMDHHSSDCLPVEKFPTFASGFSRIGDQEGFQVLVVRFAEPGRVILLEEESPAYADGSALAS